MSESRKGHLKAWMEDATNDILRATRNDVAECTLDSSERGDLQAARELAALEGAAREALKILEYVSQQHPAINGGPCARLRAALQALED